MSNKLRKITIPYSKELEEKYRTDFWNSRNKYFSPKRGVVYLENLATIEERPESKVLSDKGVFTKELISFLDFEILINELPPKEKTSVRLRCEGLSKVEASETTNMKRNNVKQARYRAYKKIKEKITRVRNKQIKRFGELYE